jgi:hypothetical protein
MKTILLSALFCASLNANYDHFEEGTVGDPHLNQLGLEISRRLNTHPKIMEITERRNERRRRGLTDPDQLSDSDRQAILDAHNDIRSLTARGEMPSSTASNQPSGCDIGALRWSSALESLATDWASLCYFGHRSSGSAQTYMDAISSDAEWSYVSGQYIGENIYISGASPALNAVFGDKDYGVLGGIEDSWSSNEAQYYDFANDECAGVCGHYTQVVAAETRYVGCGFRTCNGVQYSSGSVNQNMKTMLVCNYFPQRSSGQPYTEGDACTCCQADRKQCTHDAGLCGGGWSSYYDDPSATATQKETVDICSDGTGRNVCDGQTVDSSVSNTDAPTKAPTPRPTSYPTPQPTPQPNVPGIQVTSDSTGGSGDYVIAVSARLTWLSYSTDYDDIAEDTASTIVPLFMAYFPSLEYSTETLYDTGATTSQFSYGGTTYTYYYGTVWITTTMLNADEDAVTGVQAYANGDFAADLCDAITELYSCANTGGTCGKTLSCYSSAVDSVDYMSADSFTSIGKESANFSVLNLNSYSYGDVFMLVIFLLIVYCLCACAGYYAHKKKFQKDLEYQLMTTQSFDLNQHEKMLHFQMSVNQRPDLLESAVGRFKK